MRSRANSTSVTGRRNAKHSDGQSNTRKNEKARATACYFGDGTDPTLMPRLSRELRRGRDWPRNTGAQSSRCPVGRSRQGDREIGAAEISARARGRAVICEWPRPHSEARRERRRHVVKSRATVAAGFLCRRVHAQPVSARGAFRVQALHGPARQILHAVASQRAWAEGGAENRSRRAKICRPRTPSRKLRGFCAGAF